MRKLFCMMALAGSFLFSPAPGRFSPDGSGEPYYPHDVTRVITTTIAITITAPIGLITTGTVKPAGGAIVSRAGNFRIPLDRSDRPL